ncbi:aldo/keto reductase [Bacteriovorax sp. Seq25_V]|uniref:aldo/keto reductase n=1 Tax=Bacteriovorax sp. Seq25_V TaxID=1201288 RepID=UPI000389EC6F|nr:aldo/keto reductase [Bacteriovorax sp. Seq25_V]EQC46649.1 oxidoreductase, aldo/keto reductase family protein [Bacteriovorax sp. Seq25_V]
METLLSKFSKIPISFGGASISGEGAGYGFGDISESEAIKLLHYAQERGIQIYDTAPIYGFGESEKRIGKAFKKRRDEVFIVSKSGVTWAKNKRVDMSNDPKVTESMLIQSLRDLDSDYIDLYMVHWPDARVDIRRPMEVLAKAQAQGKIKHIGLCNTNKEDFILASEVAKIETIQSQLNFFERESVDSILPICKEFSASFMSWGTLDKGILTGRVTRDRKFDRDDCRSWAPWWKQMDKESKFKKMDIITPILREKEHTPLELAISYNLSLKEVTTVLCGARNANQLDGLLDALEKRVDPVLIEELSKI